MYKSQPKITVRIRMKIVVHTTNWVVSDIKILLLLLWNWFSAEVQHALGVKNISHI